MWQTACLAAFLVLAMVTVSTMAESLPDPTRPDVGGAQATVSAVRYEPVLQSTLVSPQRRSAVISGQRVKIGDIFEGATVMDITPHEVRLSRGGHETTLLRLQPKLVKEKGDVE